MPEISVIVPVYNVEKYLNRCIESILCQTFTDIEIILVDDGSLDGCPAICDAYAEKYTNVRVFHKKNEGVSVARNEGVKNALGKFVIFVDSDDWIAPQCLELLYRNLVDKKADISVCEMIEVSDNISFEVKDQNDLKEFHDNRDAIVYFANLNNHKFRSPWAKLIRKEIAFNNKFPSNRRFSEDTATVYKWYWDAKVVIDSNAILYYYYQNQESCVHSLIGKFKPEILLTLNELLSFFKDNNFYEQYEKYMHDYLFQMAYQSELAIKDKHDEDIARKIKKELKNTIKNNRDVKSVSPLNDPQAFNVAYPKSMELFWRFQRLKEILHLK